MMMMMMEKGEGRREKGDVWMEGGWIKR